MNKKIALTLLVPLLLTSCRTNTVSLDAIIKHIDKIENTGEHPYYVVAGSIDIGGRITEITEGVFDKMPNGSTYVANARYNEGFYNARAERTMMHGVDYYDESEIVIYGMASRSYWTRMPLRLHKDNFYVTRIDEDTGEEELNLSCGFANLHTLIVAWDGAYGTINAPGNKDYYQILPDGGFVFGGDNIRTKIYIDNYPFYMNYETHPELGGEWDPNRPLPLYSYAGDGYIDGRFYISFEYDKDGWLRREYIATSDYDVRKTTQGQMCLEAVYNYKFS